MSSFPDPPADKWECLQRFAAAEDRLIRGFEQCEKLGLHPDALDKFRRGIAERDPDLQLEAVADLLEWAVEQQKQEGK